MDFGAPNAQRPNNLYMDPCLEIVETLAYLTWCMRKVSRTEYYKS